MSRSAPAAAPRFRRRGRAGTLPPMRRIPLAQPLSARLPSALLAAALLAGCGAEPPTVPPAAPVGPECSVPDPPKATADPQAPAGTGRFLPPPQQRKALGPGGLSGLRPQDGPQAGLPLSLPQMLSARHPPSDMQWRALPPGSDASLTTLIADADEDPKVRARAMHGLSVRAPEGGDATLRAVLRDDSADPTARRAAARALAHGYVGKAPAATEALTAALKDDDARLRETVVRALSPHADRKDVRAALTAQAAVEKNALVKEALDAALAGSEP